MEFNTIFGPVCYKCEDYELLVLKVSSAPKQTSPGNPGTVLTFDYLEGLITST